MLTIRPLGELANDEAPVFLGIFRPLSLATAATGTYDVPDHRFRTACLIAGGMGGCRHFSVALSRQLKYALIPVGSTRIFKNFGVRSCRAYGRQDHDALHACLECGCRGVRSPLDRLRKAVSNESGGISPTDRSAENWEGELSDKAEVVAGKAVAALVRHRPLYLGPTGTGFIQVRLNRS